QLDCGKLSENVGLGVRKRNSFAPLDPTHDATGNEDYRCHSRKCPTCDPLRTCDACLRLRGASLSCFYLSDLHLIALEGLLPFLAFGFLACGRERDELLDIGNGQVTGVCEQRACALQLKACRQQQILASSLLLPLRLGLHDCRPRTQPLPVSIDPLAQ